MLFIIRTRDNVRVEDDYALAEWELRGLFGKVYGELPDNVVWRDFSDSLRQSVSQAFIDDDESRLYWCEQPKTNILDIFHRLTYAQQVAVCAGNEQRHELLKSRDDFHWCSEIIEVGDSLILLFVPLFCILELGEVASSSKSAAFQLEKMVRQLLASNHESYEFKRFTEKRTSTYLAHGAHIYKAKFFPRVIRTIANGLLPNTKGSLLLDPFVGSGTSQIEASALGMSSIGIDMDPLCTEITSAKLGLLESGQAGDSQEIDSLFQAFANKHGAQLPIFSKEVEAHPLTLPEFLKRRLPREMVEEIVGQGSSILAVTQAAPISPRVKALSAIALSDALSRKVRFRFHGLGHGRFALELGKKPLIDLFRSQLSNMRRTLEVYQFLREQVPFPSTMPSSVIRGDARVIPLYEESVDLVITSPPYIPASSGRENYAKTRALSFMALNIATESEIERLDNDITGSMNRRPDSTGADMPLEAREFVSWLSNDPNRNLKAEPTKAYFADLKAALVQCHRVLKQGACCVFIVAKTNTFYTYKTREITRVFNNESVTKKLGEQAGFRVKQVLHSKLDKMNPVARPRSKDEYFESIIVFEKR